MKNSILLFILVSVSFVANAQKKKQEKDLPLRKNYLEVGLNITGAIQTFVQNRTDSIYSDPYALTLKYVKNRGAFRFGFGYSFNSTKNITLFQARVRGLNRLDIRAGLEYQYPINNHWRIYAGADFLYGSINDSGVTNEGDIDKTLITDIDEKSIGAGPILGIQYNLNKRISFQTEATFYGINTKETRTYRFANGTETPPETRNAFIFPPGIPRSIAIIVRF